MASSEYASKEDASKEVVSKEDASTIASKETNSTKPKRGKICLKRLAKRRGNGLRPDVEFNSLGQPLGKYSAELQSYIGLITREQVRVNIKSWREVNQDVKELIWESVKANYNVPEEWKTRCLESAGTKWRTWKTRLYNKYIAPNTNDHQKLFEPPPDSGILPLDWNQFVISRMSNEFKALSDLQRERAKKHDYPHSISRLGYPKLIEEIKKEGTCDRFSIRGVAWRRARTSKDGKVKNAKTKEVIEKMDQIIQEKEEGTFTSNESDDLLSIALEKTDRPGRVRAVGAGVTHGGYFKTVGGRGEGLTEKSIKELDDAKRKIDEQDKVISDLVRRLGNLESKVGEHDKLSEGYGSCSVKLPDSVNNLDSVKSKDVVKQPDSVKPLDLIEEEKEVVNLPDSLISPGQAVALLLGPSKTIVAYGTMIVVGDKLHGVPMPKGCFRVSVDEVVDGDALLPFCVSDEIKTVGSALATHVAWPANLVEERLIEKPTPSKKRRVDKQLFAVDKVQDVDSLPVALKSLHFVMEHTFTDGKGLTVKVDTEVFGMDVPIWVLFKQDVVPFCNLEPITGTCIAVYIWSLYKSMDEIKNKFMFVNPFCISYSKGRSCEARGRALADRLLTARSEHVQLVLAPCNTGNHWILIIIEPLCGKVYVMDPLNPRRHDKDLKKVVDIAVPIFMSHKDKTNIKKIAPPTYIEGNEQPDGKQCGFYVMRYMKEIMAGFKNDGSTSLTSLFQTKKCYTQDQINEIREEWGTCLIKELGRQK